MNTSFLNDVTPSAIIGNMIAGGLLLLSLWLAKKTWKVLVDVKQFFADPLSAVKNETFGQRYELEMFKVRSKIVFSIAFSLMLYALYFRFDMTIHAEDTLVFKQSNVISTFTSFCSAAAFAALISMYLAEDAMLKILATRFDISELEAEITELTNARDNLPATLKKTKD